MTKLELEQDVIALASKLKLRGNPVNAIVEYCQDNINKWVSNAGGVNDIQHLEELVASQLNLAFEDVYTDEDLDEIKYRYAQKGEFVFATLKDDLDEDTFGTMIRLKDGCFVAVIDCRGQQKFARRFFTRWHEIAHLLVEDNNFEKQVFRSTRDPLERLMDLIAGHVGFYDPLFNPSLEQHYAHGDLLTFDTIEQVRQSYCSHASFQATLFACHRRVDAPILYLEAAMRLREEERRKQRQKTFLNITPTPKLRVSTTVPNKAAQNTNLTVRWNMQIPETSVIFLVQSLPDDSELAMKENLEDWTFSKGGGLAPCEVFVQARKFGDGVLATIQQI